MGVEGINPVERSGAYYTRGNWQECETAKHAYREQVMKHIAAVHRGSELRFFGLPGIFWQTERMLLSRYPKSRFVGAEHDFSVAEQSQQYMPTGGQTSVGITAGKQVYRRKRAELYMTKASTYLNEICPSDVRFNSVWLDFTTNCGQELISSCRGLARHLADGPVPFAITCLCGREVQSEMDYIRLLAGSRRRSATEQRAETMRIVLKTSSGRDVTITNQHGYRSVTGTFMMCVLGLISCSRSSNV